MSQSHRPIVINGLGLVSTTLGPRMARIVSLSERRVELEDLVSGRHAFVDRRYFRPITAADQSRWIAVDLDGTLLESVPKTAGSEEVLPLGTPRDGAAEFCQALKELDCRVSIYTARFYFLDEGTDTSAEIKRIAEHLRQHGIAYDDIYVGRKPPAHAFVDDKGISAVDLGFPEIVERIRDLTRTAGLRLGRLGIDQALEKAKSMIEGEQALSQESYHDITMQMDEMDRYPFAMALVEHGISVRTGTKLLGQTRHAVYLDEASYGLGVTADSLIAAVNIVDPPETVDETHDLSFGSEFPAGELPDESSGTLEHSYPTVRKTEGSFAIASDLRSLAAKEAGGFGLELTDLSEETVEEPSAVRDAESFLTEDDPDEDMEQEAVSIENLAKDDRQRDPMEGKISMKALVVW